MYSRALAIIGGFLILASGAGEIYRQKARRRSLQSTGQIFLGIYLICVVRATCVSHEDPGPGVTLTCSTAFCPPGVLPAAQQRGPTGLPEPHRWRGAHSDAGGGSVRRSGPGLPLWLLHPPGGSDPGHRPSSGHPPHRREHGLLAQQPQGGVLEPDEADWT